MRIFSCISVVSQWDGVVLVSSLITEVLIASFQSLSTDLIYFYYFIYLFFVSQLSNLFSLAGCDIVKNYSVPYCTLGMVVLSSSVEVLQISRGARDTSWRVCTIIYIFLVVNFVGMWVTRFTSIENFHIYIYIFIFLNFSLIHSICHESWYYSNACTNFHE